MSPSIEACPIGRAHHAAFRCRDAVQTIWFYQGVPGPVADGALMLPEQLARWSARTREQKIAKFGEAALLQRGRSKPQTKEA